MERNKGRSPFLGRTHDTGAELLLLCHRDMPFALPAVLGSCSLRAPSVRHLGADHLLDHGNFGPVDIQGQAMVLVIIGEKVGLEFEGLQVGEQLQQSSESGERQWRRGIFGDGQVTNRGSGNRPRGLDRGVRVGKVRVMVGKGMAQR